MMLSRRTVLLSCALLAAFGLSLMPAKGLHAASSADEFVRDMGQEAIQTLTGTALSDPERRERFRTILQRTFDMPVIARSTLGQYWRVATEDQRKEYVALFEEFVVQAYGARFKDYSGEAFRVGQTRTINDREKLVGSEIVRAQNQPAVQVHWRVRTHTDFKVVDVIVEGISMLVTHRDEFAAVIQQNGGKVEGLLRDLRTKTGQTASR